MAKHLHVLLTAVIILALSGGVSAVGLQNSDIIEERDEYGFPTISCGAGFSTTEYRAGSPERILVTEQIFTSAELSDQALEERSNLAKTVLEQETTFDDRGKMIGRRVVAVFDRGVVAIERRGTWLRTTEAASLYGLQHFEQYKKGK